ILFLYCPARPHFSQDRRTNSPGYSRSCSEPPDIVARASIALTESANPTTKYLCARKLVPSRQHVQRNLLSDLQCAHARPQFISVMWPDLGDHGDGRKIGLCSLVARARPDLFCERCDDPSVPKPSRESGPTLPSNNCDVRWAQVALVPKCFGLRLSSTTRGDRFSNRETVHAL